MRRNSYVSMTTSIKFQNCNLDTRQKSTRLLKCVIVGLLFILTSIANLYSAKYYSIASGDWDSNNTWSTTSGGSAVGTGIFPIAGDEVYIERGYTVTVNIATAACTYLNIGRAATYGGGATVTGFLNFATSGSPVLTVSGNVQIGGSFNSTSYGTVTFQNGSTLLAGSLLFGNSTSKCTGTITMTNGGTLTLNGLLTVVGAATFTAGTGTIVVNATNTLPSTSINNVIVSSGTATLGGATTIKGNLSINNGAELIVPAAITVNGTTTIGNGTSGNLTISSATGAKTFTGLVTINNGGAWTNTTKNSTAIFQGGITNNGTFNAGTGVQTFNINSQALTGTFSIPNVTVNGTGVTLTNSNTLTVGTALSGSGGLTQAADAILNIGGTVGISTLTATNTNNTVKYIGAAQTVKTANYYNLTLSGSGAKTLQTGMTAIAGNFTTSGTIATTGVVGLTIGGNVVIGSGTTFTSGTFSHAVGGNWTNNGTFTAGTGTVTFTGSGKTIGGTNTTTFYNLTLNSAASISLGISTNVSRVLTLTNGILNTSSANLLSTTYTNVGAIVGGSATSFINGPIKQSLPASLVSGSPVKVVDYE